MGDHQPCRITAPAFIVKAGPHFTFCSHIKRAREVVDHDELRCMGQHTSHGCALYLPAGEANAAGTHYRLEPLLHPGDILF